MNPAHVEDSAQSAAGAELLAQIDLNLFVALDALVRERSVTAAARRVGVTQSAMSHTLKRLRDLFGDPLLVRGRQGLVLTPRAEAVVLPLRASLAQLARTLTEREAFEPQRATRIFRVGTPELFDVLGVPALLRRLRRLAPGVDLQCVPVQHQLLAAVLETGELDAAIVPQADELSPGDTGADAGLVQRTLFRDSYACFIRADHPALAQQGKRQTSKPRAGARGRAPVPLSLSAYAELSHALISPSGEGKGAVDVALAAHGLRRRVALRVPHFSSALSIVRESDLILTAPLALASLLSAGSAVAVLAPPLPLPDHKLNLIWHQRFAGSAESTWLRQQLTEVAEELILRARKVAAQWLELPRGKGG